jgi:hypothetical protein
MNVFRINSSYNGIKYDVEGDRLSISGNQVIILGIILLIVVIIYYLVDRREKAHK